LAALAAEAEARAGRPDEARALVSETLAESARFGFVYVDSDLWRVAGETHAGRRPPNFAAAREEFKSAIVIARARRPSL